VGEGTPAAARTVGLLSLMRIMFSFATNTFPAFSNPVNGPVVTGGPNAAPNRRWSRPGSPSNV